MIHLKTFEKLLKYDDPNTINNPLFEFSNRIFEIVLGIKKLDNFDNSTVKKFYNENGKISIAYTDNAELLKITMNVHSEIVTMSISYGSARTNDVDKNSKEFYYFVQNKLKKYTTLKTYKSLEIYNIPINKLNKINNIIEEFFEYINLNMAVNKYNL